MPISLSPATDTDTTDLNKLDYIKQNLPKNGTLSTNCLVGLGIRSCSYTPNPGYFGADAFSYLVKDQDGLSSAVVIVSIKVNEKPKYAPIAGMNQIFDVNQDQYLDFEVSLASDQDSTNPSELKYVLSLEQAEASQFSNCFIEAGNRMCRYTPEIGFYGTKVFNYTVQDKDLLSSAPATMTFNVRQKQNEYIQTEKKLQITSLSNTVCDPLSGDVPGEDGKGLVGNIRLLNNPDDRSIRDRLYNYLNPAMSYEVEGLTLFMGKVDVPKRAFDLGFSSQDGGVLSVNGEALTEYFNINLESTMRIDTDEAAGEYELAVISDDGSKLSIKAQDATEFQVYTYSPETHSPKMICSQTTTDIPNYVTFNKGENLDIKMNYFQGPRVHIALQFIWRKKVPGQRKSNFCNTGITTDNFQYLASDGWEVIPAEVFNLPSDVVNSCTTMNEKLNSVVLKVPLPGNTSSNELIKDLKVFVKDVETEAQVQLTNEEYSISDGVQEAGEMLYEIVFTTSIERDSDKEILLQYKVKGEGQTYN